MATLLRADSLRNAGSYAEAIEAYREVNDKKGIPGSWRLRALTGMAENKPRREASRLCDKRKKARRNSAESRTEDRSGGVV